MSQDLIEPLSHFVAETTYDSLPRKAVESCKLILLDSLGVALAGSSAPGVEFVVEQARQWGGTPESQVIVYGDQLPLPWTSLVNGMMIQARDFDDTHHEAIVHVNAGVLPAALGMSQLLKNISGKRFLTALILGIDVACRIGKAINTPVAFTRTGTLAYFGATAAACHLLDLDARIVQQAFGIAYSQASGNMQAVQDGGLVKRMHPGFGAMAGVMSALWAERGLSGSRNILEGTYGYMNLYEQGNYDREKVLLGLGDSYEVTQLSIKPYPCSLDTHGAIMAALDLRERHDVKPEMIDRVTIELPFLAYDAAGKPFKQITGHKVVESILSVPYAVAVALQYGKVNLDNFTEEAVREREVGNLAALVEPILDESLPAKAFVPVTTKIYLKNGKVLEKRVETLLGTPENPIGKEALLEKFWHCASYASLPLPRKKLEKAIELVQEAETLEQIDALVENITV